MAGFEDLLERCRAGGRKAEIVEESWEEGEDGEGHYRGLRVEVPKGGSVREVDIPDHLADEVGGTRFELFEYVEGYDAIWSAKLGVVECALQRGQRSLDWKFALNRLSRVFPSEIFKVSEKIELRRIELPSQLYTTITIRPASEEHILLGGQLTLNVRMVEGVGPPTYCTLEIHSQLIQDQASAKKVLEELGNAILFECDVAFDSSIYLAPEPGSWRIIGFGRRDTSATPAAPSRSYNAEALRLYWNGRSAHGAPLLEYLAFYQVLEYFFPWAARKTAIETARDVLQSPGFDDTQDDEVGRLVEGVKWPESERQNLELVIKRAVGAGELQAFLSGERAKALTSPECRRLSSKVVAPNDSHADLRRQVTVRVYNIRCRIVHAKASGTKDRPLFPYSPEISFLDVDTELVEWLARQALNATADPL